MKGPLNFLLTLALATVVSNAIFCGKSGGGAGAMAPDFMLDDLDGDRWYLSRQEGSVVLINFWSVHCAPCMREMPLLQALCDSLRRRKAVVVGICNDPGEAGYAGSLVKKLGITYPVLIDENKTVSNLYHVTGLPTTVIIDAAGRKRYSFTGYDEGYVRRYAAIMGGLLHECETH